MVLAVILVLLVAAPAHRAQRCSEARRIVTCCVAADTIIVADGFSCREQIARMTGRGAIHLAGLVHMAMFHGQDGPAAPGPSAPPRD